jgi:hypothetical protein
MASLTDPDTLRGTDCLGYCQQFYLMMVMYSCYKPFSQDDNYAWFPS